MDDSGEPRIPPRHVAELTGSSRLMTGGCSATRACAPAATASWPPTWSKTRSRRPRGPGRRCAGMPARRQRAWLLGTLVNKDISDFRRKEAFRRRQPDIQARYQATAADTAAQALNAIALERAREIIEDMPPRTGTSAGDHRGDAAAAEEGRADAVAGPDEGLGDRRRAQASRRVPCTPICIPREASWSPGWSGTTRSARTAGREPRHDRRRRRASGP